MAVNNNPPECRTYLATSVTLTTAGTNYNLSTLLLAINENYPLTGREITIQIDVAVAGTVRIGDPLLSATICGYALNSGESRTYRSDARDIAAGMLTLRPSVNAMVVNIEIFQ